MGTTRAGFMVNISTGHHNSRASAGITLYTSATYIRVPTAMEFHPVRYDINLWRINAVPGPPPFPSTRSLLAPYYDHPRPSSLERRRALSPLAFSPFPFTVLKTFLEYFRFSEIPHSVNLWPEKRLEEEYEGFAKFGILDINLCNMWFISVVGGIGR